jgi:hypothetical protein
MMAGGGSCMGFVSPEVLGILVIGHNCRVINGDNIGWKMI